MRNSKDEREGGKSKQLQWFIEEVLQTGFDYWFDYIGLKWFDLNLSINHFKKKTSRFELN